VERLERLERFERCAVLNRDGTFGARSIFRRCRSRLHDLLYFLARGPSRVASPLSNFVHGISGRMTDLSRDVPSAMTDLRGHIACRVADRSTGFFNLRAAGEKNIRKY